MLSLGLSGGEPLLRDDLEILVREARQLGYYSNLITSGIDGIERGLALEPRFDGNAYALDSDRVPHTLQMARELWAGSDWAKQAFGEGVHKHYLNMADVELAQFNRGITDWERVRTFERY